MDSIAQILSALIGVAMVLLIAPRVMATNRGKILQNIAIWVGIFLILALVYRTYGPGKLEPQNPESAATSQTMTRSVNEPADKQESGGNDSEPALNEDQGFMPPREE